MMEDTVDTIFGKFASTSKRRLDLTFDYETCAIRSFKKIAELINSSIVLDIGANIGVYSVYVSSLDCIQEIHAFEPAPQAFAELQKNILVQQSTKKFHAHDIALSDMDGEVQFNIVAPMSGANKITNDESKKSTSVTVNAKPLDKVIFNSNSIASVKIDVEGHEKSTIIGATNFFRNNKCFIQVESLQDHRFHEMRAELENLGYSKVFCLRDDYLFLHVDLMHFRDKIIELISEQLSDDLEDLKNLRVEKRQIALEARKIRELAGYKKDPVMR